MNWQDIKVSRDGTHFIYKNKPVFSQDFMEVIKFHAPGLAPVKDETGWHHIDVLGNRLYPESYSRVFGFYTNRAAVMEGTKWFHISAEGTKAYEHTYSWAGNYQEGLCTVRERTQAYFHIDIHGQRNYIENYIYAGDFKDGYACVKTERGWKHIDSSGCDLNGKCFEGLSVFHKAFAMAKDADGWFHIDKNGRQLYIQRYSMLEPFYNGFSFVVDKDSVQKIINEQGEVHLELP